MCAVLLSIAVSGDQFAAVNITSATGVTSAPAGSRSDNTLLYWCFSFGVCAGPVLRCNDTEDARARVLDSEELIAYLQRRAQQAVDSRDDTSEHLRHVSTHPCLHAAAKDCFP